jgi:hypothetical protein
MNSDVKLKELLLKNATHPLVQRYVKAIGGQTALDYKVTEPGPVVEIRDIYKRRARLNQKRHGTIEGFDELIPALDAENDASIVVHVLEIQGEAFTVFTNVSTTRLIGLLVTHKK